MRTWSTLASALVALALAGGAGAAFPGSNGRLTYFYEAEVWRLRGAGGDAAAL